MKLHRLLLLLMVGTILFLPPASRCQTTSTKKPLQNEARFPLSTEMVFVDGAHHRVYAATDSTLREIHSGATFLFPEAQYGRAEAITFTPDGKKLLLRRTFDAFLLEAKSLHLLTHINTRFVWLEGSKLVSIDQDDNDDADREYVKRGNKRTYFPRGMHFVAVSQRGSYLMGTKVISRGNRAQYNVPTLRFLLLRRTRRGSFVVVKKLPKYTYDGASSGEPFYCEVLSSALFAFGMPGSRIDTSRVGFYRAGHVVKISQEEVSKSFYLLYVHTPVLAGNAIVGLAQKTRWSDRHPMSQMYFYRLTKRGLVIKKVAANVEFVTYDAKKHRVGMGYDEKDAVILRWMR